MFFFIVGFVAIICGVCGLDSTEISGCMTAIFAGIIMLIVGASGMGDKGDNE